MKAHRKRPRDPAQLAKFVVDLATMDDSERLALQRRLKSPKKAKGKGRQTPGKRGSSGTGK